MADHSKPNGPAGKKRVRKTWYQTHGRDLRFLAIFAVLMGLYYLASTTETMEERFFPWYLRTNAQAAGGIVHLFGHEQMRVNGKSLIDPRGAISVERGCDAMEATALYVSAVLASPAALGSRFAAAALGTVILAVINLIRIITLFLTNVHWKRAFDVMHLDVWQAAFILIAIVMWAFWASWESRRRQRRSDAQT